MSANSNGMVMYDSDYVAAAKYIEKYCVSLIEIIDSYTNTLFEITEEAVVDQKICSALANLSNQTDSLKQIIADVSKKATKASSDFVSAVDSADSFLY